MRHALKDGVIVANSIKIGKGVTFGRNVTIVTRGAFEIGDFSRIGDDVNIRANNVWIGKHFYHSRGLRVGGGGSNGPNANLWIGDRCVMHNNFLNVSEHIVIGNDVGLSEDVTILTHGYWLSVLDGNPAKFEGVRLDDGVIVGYRSTILPGVVIGGGTVIGADSTVTKSLTRKGVYAGNPAQFIRRITQLTEEDQSLKALEIIRKYREVAEFHNRYPVIEFKFPEVRVDDFTINLLTLQYSGRETDDTDHFRDYLRRWGIRIYTERPFG